MCEGSGIALRTRPGRSPLGRTAPPGVKNNSQTSRGALQPITPCMAFIMDHRIASRGEAGRAAMERCPPGCRVGQRRRWERDTVSRVQSGSDLVVLDGLKGLAPLFVARWAGFTDPWLVAIELAAVSGNNWPVWRAERAGRGLATSVGVVGGFAPALVIWPGLWAAIGWWVGGGPAGFAGWGFLGAWAFWTGAGSPATVLAPGLGTMMALRRVQGNAGFERSGAWRRVIFVEDHRLVSDPTRPLAMGGGRLLWVFTEAGLGVTSTSPLWGSGGGGCHSHHDLPCDLLLAASAPWVGRGRDRDPSSRSGCMFFFGVV